jgi:hypothetical protein
MQGMYERNPRFAKFSAMVAGKKVSWSSKEPCLTGDPGLIAQIHDELSKGIDYQIVINGPYVLRDYRKAAPVYIALLKLFGEDAVFTNPPNLDRFWFTPDMLDEFGNLRDGLVF